MSRDTYNVILQLANGRWIVSTGHNMTELMDDEERTAYKRALDKLNPADTEIEFDSEEEAWEAADEVGSEHGTFPHHYRDFFND